MVIAVVDNLLYKFFFFFYYFLSYQVGLLFVINYSFKEVTFFCFFLDSCDNN